MALALSVVHEITRRGTVIKPAIGAPPTSVMSTGGAGGLALLDLAALVGRPAIMP